MFSNTLSFLSSYNINDQVSHPYKTTGEIIFSSELYYNIKLKRQGVRDNLEVFESKI